MKEYPGAKQVIPNDLNIPSVIQAVVCRFAHMKACKDKHPAFSNKFEEAEKKFLTEIETAFAKVEGSSLTDQTELNTHGFFHTMAGDICLSELPEVIAKIYQALATGNKELEEALQKAKVSSVTLVSEIYEEIYKKQVIVA